MFSLVFGRSRAGSQIFSFLWIYFSLSQQNIILFTWSILHGAHILLGVHHLSVTYHPSYMVPISYLVSTTSLLLIIHHTWYPYPTCTWCPSPLCYLSSILHGTHILLGIHNLFETCPSLPSKAYSTALDLLLFFHCSLTSTPPPNNALLVNMDM